MGERRDTTHFSILVVHARARWRSWEWLDLLYRLIPRLWEAHDLDEGRISDLVGVMVQVTRWECLTLLEVPDAVGLVAVPFCFH